MTDDPREQPFMDWIEYEWPTGNRHERRKYEAQVRRGLIKPRFKRKYL